MQELQATLVIWRIYLSDIWRKKRYMVGSMWITCIIGWVGVSLMPNLYESSTRIHADTKNILKPLLTGLAVQGNTDNELMVISKTLLSRPNLESIARQTDLYLDYTKPDEYEGMLKALSKEIKLTGNKSKVYSISYQHPDPDMAKKIVEVTMQKFTESILGQARSDNNAATGFLIEEIDKLKVRLEQSESALATFKQVNQHLLPRNGSGYYQRVYELNDEIESIDYLLNEKDAEISGLKTRFSDVGDEDEPSFSVATKYDEKIYELKMKLDMLNVQYTSQHPSVIDLVKSIKSLEERRMDEQKQILNQAINGGITVSTEGNAGMQDLSLRIAVLDSEKNVLISRRANNLLKLNKLKEKLDMIPSVEAELKSLTRDYDVINTSYNSLLSRKESAELSSNVAQNTSSVKFLVLDPPMKPLFPIGPPRTLLYGAVFLLSIGLGFFISFFISQMSAVVSSPTHLKQIIGNDTLIGQIEDLNSEQHKKAAKIKGIIFALSTALLVVVFVALITHEIIYGLSPIMWL